MKLFFISILIALFAAFTMAVTETKSFIVTYTDPNTPESVLDQAKKAIEDAGGFITHEYTVIKGFAAQGSAKAMEMVQTLGAKYMPVVEEDQVVSAWGNSI